MKKRRTALLTSLLALLLCVSMLMGTTLAWFTDSVSSKNNQILAGSLDVELEQYVDGKWVRVNESTNVFEEDALWEPGHTEVVYLRIANVGDLALKYGFGVNIAEETGSVNVAGEDFKLSDHIRYGIILSDSQQTYADREAARSALKVSQLINQGYSSNAGSLYPEDNTQNLPSMKYVTMVVYMPEEVGNEANYAAGAAIPTIKLGLTLMATQEVHESDSFGSDYDASAEVPGFDFPDNVFNDNVTVPVETDTEGKLSAAVTLQGDRTTAEVPAGVLLANGVTDLNLTTGNVDQSEANVTLSENESQRSVDVHIEGVSPDNTVPMTITLEEVAPKGLNMGNYKLYHVENGQTVEMTYVASDAAFTAHNQFKYDPATGDMVLYMATFSEVALVADTINPWNGDVDHTWYDADADTLTIASADQLWSFSQLVGGMAKNENGTYLLTDEDGQPARDSFYGKTIKLITDINLADDEEHNVEGKIFYPIGYNSNDGKYEKTHTAISSSLKTFEGTFDGQGHIIANFYHNTWEMKGDHDWYAPEEQYYRDGMGLFGRVYGGTVKNLTVSNFSSDGEIATTGTIAAYADCGATFENIAIFNCNPRVYNIGNGGIVGCVGWYAKEADTKVTFRNITVDKSNKISALWGSYDVACGGIVGQYYPTSGQSSANYPVNGGIDLINCHVAAQMDVYNDVCANYQYYAYRYTGMLIGSIRENVTVDGHSYPKMDGIEAKDCTVHFGTWNDYYYCEIIDNTTASYTHDYQMSRLTEIKAIDGTTITYLDGTTGTVPTSGRANYVVVNGEHATENATCYHFKDGAVWTHDMGGIQTGIDENGDGKDDLKEDKQHIYLEFNNLVTGYGWGVTSKGVGDLTGVTILDREIANSVEKFDVVEPLPNVVAGEEYTVGDFFKAKSELEVAIDTDNVQVFVSPEDSTNVVYVEYTPNTEDWTKGTLKFYGQGAAKIVITDYFYCKEILANVTVAGDSILFRVGNAGFEGDTTYDVTYKDIARLLIGKEEYSTIELNKTELKYTVKDGKVDFSDTGIVGVKINGVQYYLEVVKAENISSARSSNGKDVVLLRDVKISSDGTVHYTACTVYGNGFTFDVRGGMNQYNSKQGHGIIIAKHATLDHLRIIGDIYDEYGLYAKDFSGNLMNDYTSAVDAEFCVIQNCYIANCATPIRSNGNTIIDTTLYGGTVANLLISGGANTLTNVTTVNYNDGRGVIGMGIVITDGANVDGTELILNGYLKQHNYVYESDVSEITVEEAKTVFNSMFGDKFADYHIGSNPKAVNTGIISINEDIKLTDTVFEDNVNTGYLVTNEVEIQISVQGVTTKVKANVASVPGNGGSVDNNFEDNGNEQGDYLPTFDFNLGDQAQAKDNDDDTRYLIGDKNGLSAMYPKGEAALTLDLTELATVTKYTNVSYPVTAKCIGPDGKEQTGTVTLADKGTYTLVFTVDDNVHYDENGNKIEKSVPRTYEVTLVLDLYEKSIADATMTISSSNLAGEYVNSGSNKKYKMYPLKAITSIMDDANKDGVLETFDFKSNIQSAVLTPESNNAFSSPTTITITYTGGQVLTIVLGTPSGLNSPGASNGGKTFSVVTDNTNGNGIYLQSDGAIASSSAVDGTWPLTSWSFKGTSGKVITNSTKVTIDFTKPSSGSCVTGDTLITLADGSQVRVDALTGNEELLVWNLETGKYDTAPIVFVDTEAEAEVEVVNLYFSDGSKVGVIYEHGFFDYKLGEYVYIDATNAQSYVGHRFVTQGSIEDGSWNTAILTKVEIEKKVEKAYSPVTFEHLCYYTDGVLSMPGGIEGLFNIFEVDTAIMAYDAEKKAADIEKYGLLTLEDFGGMITEDAFDAFNGAYLNVAIGKGLLTWEDIAYMAERYIPLM